MIVGFADGMTCDFHHAIHIVWLTAANLDLYCRVRNPEIVLQLLGDGA
jgi:hypothetical protein